MYKQLFGILWVFGFYDQEADDKPNLPLEFYKFISTWWLCKVFLRLLWNKPQRQWKNDCLCIYIYCLLSVKHVIYMVIHKWPTIDLNNTIWTYLILIITNALRIELWLV